MTLPYQADPPPITGDSTADAVVVIPGIMGSNLVEEDTGRSLWGMERALQYSARWRHARSMKSLHVTEDERAGCTGRIQPRGLLRFPAWAPMLGGIEPYTKLVNRLREAAAHPAAVLEFAYDWRLSVDHNAALLATAANDHLTAWRKHPAYGRARRADPAGREGRLVLVAHSMGGLLCWAMAGISGAVNEVRATVTMGTPFEGSVQAAEVLNSGRGTPVPLPRHRLRQLAATMPGLHDLLPTYRCLERGEDLRTLTPSDVVALGGHEELARESFRRQARLAGTALLGHRRVVGTGQPTTQSLTLADGVVGAQFFRLAHRTDGELHRDELGRPIRYDRGGDGTVYRYAADLPGTEEEPVAQQHGALARSKSVIDRVCGVLTHAAEHETVLGGADLGLVVPDFVPVSTVFEIATIGVPDPACVTCVIENAGEGNDLIAGPVLRWGVGDPEARLSARVTLTVPGLYRVLVSAGAQPVTQLVMVDEPGQEGGD